MVYALGQVNFLFDPASEPCVTADQLSAAFGLAKSTMSGKARQVRDLLRIDHFPPEFQRADMAADNPREHHPSSHSRQSGGKGK